MNKSASLLFAASILFLAIPAAAADQDPAATLRVDQGSVMTSQGGEFATAQSGQGVVAGERLMLAEDSVATLAYADGCQRQFSAPGVYVVEAECRKDTAVAWGDAAKVAGGVAIGAAVLANMDETDPPPVSR